MVLWCLCGAVVVQTAVGVEARSLSGGIEVLHTLISSEQDLIVASHYKALAF